MVTELEWGLSRWDVCLVSDQCGDPRGAGKGDSPFFLFFFFPRRCTSFKEAKESSKLAPARTSNVTVVIPEWTLGIPCQHVGLLEKRTSWIAVCIMWLSYSPFGCFRIDRCSFTWRDIHQDPFIVLLGDECSLFLLSANSFSEDNSHSSNWCWDTALAWNSSVSSKSYFTI